MFYSTVINFVISFAPFTVNHQKHSETVLGKQFKSFSFVSFVGLTMWACCCAARNGPKLLYEIPSKYLLLWNNSFNSCTNDHGSWLTDIEFRFIIQICSQHFKLNIIVK